MLGVAPRGAESIDPHLKGQHHLHGAVGMETVLCSATVTLAAHSGDSFESRTFMGQHSRASLSPSPSQRPQGEGRTRRYHLYGGLDSDLNISWALSQALLSNVPLGKTSLEGDIAARVRVVEKGFGSSALRLPKKDPHTRTSA